MTVNARRAPHTIRISAAARHAEWGTIRGERICTRATFPESFCGTDFDFDAYLAEHPDEFFALENPCGCCDCRSWSIVGDVDSFAFSSGDSLFASGGISPPQPRCRRSWEPYAFDPDPAHGTAIVPRCFESRKGVTPRLPLRPQEITVTRFNAATLAPARHAAFDIVAAGGEFFSGTAEFRWKHPAGIVFRIAFGANGNASGATVSEVEDGPWKIPVLFTRPGEELTRITTVAPHYLEKGHTATLGGTLKDSARVAAVLSPTVADLALATREPLFDLWLAGPFSAGSPFAITSLDGPSSLGVRLAALRRDVHLRPLDLPRLASRDMVLLANSPVTNSASGQIQFRARIGEGTFNVGGQDLFREVPERDCNGGAAYSFPIEPARSFGWSGEVIYQVD